MVKTSTSTFFASFATRLFIVKKTNKERKVYLKKTCLGLAKREKIFEDLCERDEIFGEVCERSRFEEG